MPPWESGRLSVTALHRLPEARKKSLFSYHPWVSNLFHEQPAFHGSIALPFVIPSAAEGSAVQRTFTGNVLEPAPGLENSSNGLFRRVRGG